MAPEEKVVDIDLFVLSDYNNPLSDLIICRVLIVEAESIHSANDHSSASNYFVCFVLVN